MGLFDFLRRLFSPRPSRPALRAPRARKRRRKPRLVRLRRRDSSTTWELNKTVRAKSVLTRSHGSASAPIATSTSRSTEVTSVWLVTRFPSFARPGNWPSGSRCRWAVSPGWCTATRRIRARKVSDKAHYHYRWLNKRAGGRRLIESPKRTLKQVQYRILREILDKVPPHGAAHGFSAGRSILTNARPHVKQAVLVKFDLANFYPSVTLARVTAIFRSLGYSREAAIWLARLTTSALPSNMPFVKEEPSAVLPYLKRHLPQGAPTSPALANLSAYSLDVRLSGLARTFGATYTRYADDLTFSGPQRFGTSLRDFIPLVSQIVRQERFRLNGSKRKVLRSTGKLIVTGVVVNEKLNVSRREFDRLKAVLTNCAARSVDAEQERSSAFRRPSARPHRASDSAQSGPRRPAPGGLQSNRLESLEARNCFPCCANGC